MSLVILFLLLIGCQSEYLDSGRIVSSTNEEIVPLDYPWFLQTTQESHEYFSIAAKRINSKIGETVFVLVNESDLPNTIRAEVIESTDNRAGGYNCKVLDHHYFYSCAVFIDRPFTKNKLTAYRIAEHELGHT